MRNTITFVLLSACTSIAAVGQPVLVNTMTAFPVGTSDSLYSASGAVAPGSGGAGATWNLSSLTPSLLGTDSVVTPSSSPYISTFPSATFCAKLIPTSGSPVYVYERHTSTKWETLANNYYGAGTGDDYTPNPESAIEFPMSYTDAFTDTFQKTSGSPSTVSISYDGYGTLITPFGTYSNVVRIQKYWGPGDYDYNWYVTSPNLGIVASYHAQTNSYTLVGYQSTTSVENTQRQPQVLLYPNPVLGNATLKIMLPAELTNAFVNICDATGRVLKHLPVTAKETTIKSGELCPGIYLYQVFNDGARISAGQITIE